MDRSVEDVRVIAGLKEAKEQCVLCFKPENYGTDALDGRYDESEDIAQLNANGEISELAVIAEGEERTTWFVWMLVACTSISGLLFGESRASSLRAVSLITSKATTLVSSPALL